MGAKDMSAMSELWGKTFPDDQDCSLVILMNLQIDGARKPPPTALTQVNLL